MSELPSRKGRVLAALLLAPLAAPVLFLLPLLSNPTLVWSAPDELALCFLVAASVAYGISWTAFAVLAPLFLALRLMRPLPLTIAAGAVGVAFWVSIGASDWRGVACSFALGGVPGYLLCRIGFPADRRQSD